MLWYLHCLEMRQESLCFDLLVSKEFGIGEGCKATRTFDLEWRLNVAPTFSVRSPLFRLLCFSQCFEGFCAIEMRREI